MIETNGPIPVSLYMQLCLHDPDDGYYANHPGLGTDFITAPEISQVFGELIGLWALHEHTNCFGEPDIFSLVELGPGRGTLMSDALRAAGPLANKTTSNRFNNGRFLDFIEASRVLQEIQRNQLPGESITFRDSLREFTASDTILIANEYLDCLPARQFVKSNGDWFERVIGPGEDGALAFGLAADRVPQDFSSGAEAAEIQPGLEILVDDLKWRDEKGRLRALFIDYGTSDETPGDTLRAFKQGKQVHPLSAPGANDLTVDVDFGRLAKLARGAGLDVHGAVTQGEFLMRLGIEQRMQSLIEAEPSRGEEIYEGVRKLVEPTEMGERFKVICISSPGLPDPAGF